MKDLLEDIIDSDWVDNTKQRLITPFGLFSIGICLLSSILGWVALAHVRTAAHSAEASIRQQAIANRHELYRIIASKTDLKPTNSLQELGKDLRVPFSQLEIKVAPAWWQSLICGDDGNRYTTVTDQYRKLYAGSLGAYPGIQDMLGVGEDNFTVFANADEVVGLRLSDSFILHLKQLHHYGIKAVLEEAPVEHKQRSLSPYVNLTGIVMGWILLWSILFSCFLAYPSLQVWFWRDRVINIKQEPIDFFGQHRERLNLLKKQVARLPEDRQRKKLNQLIAELEHDLLGAANYSTTTEEDCAMVIEKKISRLASEVKEIQQIVGSSTH